jgi:hypothetical protein
MEESIEKEKALSVLRTLINSPYKSIMRAMKRGHIAFNGMVAPKRPFNNRKNTCKRGKDSREMNSYKKMVYGKIKQKLVGEQVQ